MSSINTTQTCYAATCRRGGLLPHPPCVELLPRRFGARLHHIPVLLVREEAAKPLHRAGTRLRGKQTGAPSPSPTQKNR